MSVAARADVAEAKASAAEATAVDLKGQFEALKDELLGKRSAAAAPSPVQAVVGASGASRRLAASGGETYVAVPTIEVHEFPADATCGTGGYMRLLPVLQDGMPTFDKSPAGGVTANVSLVTVGASWATTDIQTHPAPLKVVHDASCRPTTLDTPLPRPLTHPPLTPPHITRPTPRTLDPVS